MKNVVTVKAKNVYGVEKIYPTNDLGHLLAKLAGHITFTESDIKIIKDLGYKIELAQEVREF